MFDEFGFTDERQRERIFMRVELFLGKQVKMHDLLRPWDVRFPDQRFIDGSNFKKEDVPMIQKLSKFVIYLRYSTKELFLILLYNEYGIEFHCSAAYHSLVISLCQTSNKMMKALYEKHNYSEELFYNKHWIDFQECPTKEHQIIPESTVSLWRCMHHGEQSSLKILERMYNKVFTEYHYYFYLYLKLAYARGDYFLSDTETLKVNNNHLRWMWVEVDGCPRVLKKIKDTYDHNPNIDWIEKNIPLLFGLFLNYLTDNLIAEDMEKKNRLMTQDIRTPIDDKSSIKMEDVVTQVSVFVAYYEAMRRGEKGDVLHLIDPFSQTLVDLLVWHFEEEVGLNDEPLFELMGGIFYKCPLYFEYILISILCSVIQRYLDDSNPKHLELAVLYFKHVALMRYVPLKPDQKVILESFLNKIQSGQAPSFDMSLFIKNLKQWVKCQEIFFKNNFVSKIVNQVVSLLYFIEHIMQKRVVKPDTSPYSFYISNNITGHTSHGDQGPFLEFLPYKSSDDLKKAFKYCEHQFTIEGNRLIFPRNPTLK